jgi:hypothetical protein
VHYSDPNYLASSEFSSYNDIAKEHTSEIDQVQDTIAYNYNEYDDADNYFDYSFSSRIRRFHTPMYYSNYFDGVYTDYYWYNNDPFYFGTSIYYGYNWSSPYYSYNSPYYYNNYFSYYAFGFNNYHYNTPNYTYFNTNDNKHTTGHRGSLSSYSSGRGVKTNTIIPNTNFNTSKLNIRDKNNFKNNNNANLKNPSITTKPYKVNTRVKTSTNRKNTYIKTNNSFKEKTSTKNTTNKGNRSYTAPKHNSNNKNYNSRSGKTTNRSKSSGGSNRRSTKPRK